VCEEEDLIRTWVDSEGLANFRNNFRLLIFHQRTIVEYDPIKNNWIKKYCNKTCMRFIEVAVLDQGVMRII